MPSCRSFNATFHLFCSILNFSYAWWKDGGGEKKNSRFQLQQTCSHKVIEQKLHAYNMLCDCVGIHNDGQRYTSFYIHMQTRLLWVLNLRDTLLADHTYCRWRTFENTRGYHQKCNSSNTLCTCRIGKPIIHLYHEIVASQLI